MREHEERARNVRRRRAGAAQPRRPRTSAFPHSFTDVEPIAEVRCLRGLRPARKPTSAIASRVVSPRRRGAGKAAFLDLVDRTGKIQLHARLDVLGEERCELFERSTSAIWSASTAPRSAAATAR